ncbi:MAG: hemerythrin domain-containing protein [Candidatus Obscuribacterales bacterium]|nr:hemerythrin domain-containing protein [Candidatus Obscuribacterales bacterium]
MRQGTKSSPKEAMEITELLHQDHQKVRDLFFKFKNSENKQEQEKIVEAIITELHIHATVEEEIVYPVVSKEAEDAEDLVEEAETEHHMVKHLMAELSDMSADEDHFEAKVTVLCELVGHHIREEEKEMFKKLKDSSADLEELSEKVMARKEELEAMPLPSMQSTLTIDSKKSAVKSQSGLSAARRKKTA